MIVCGLKQESKLTLSRFGTGLRENIKRSIMMRDVKTLEEAYQISHDYDIFFKSSLRTLASFQGQYDRIPP